MIEANFFWHGPRLRLYEIACIASFVQPGIQVRLYSFNRELVVPDGVELVDASALADESEVFAYTQGGIPRSIAAFSDVIRYRLFHERPGWWFDTDVFCLKPAAHFAELESRSQGILIGEQAPGELNGAVMFISDPQVAQTLSDMAKTKGTTFDWGAIGPLLIDEFVRANPSKATIVDKSVFYPIHFGEERMLFAPDQHDACVNRCEDAATIHLWNEYLRRWSIPQTIFPCDGSFLRGLFNRTNVSAAPDATLPYDAFEALRQYHSRSHQLFARMKRLFRR